MLVNNGDMLLRNASCGVSLLCKYLSAFTQPVWCSLFISRENIPKIMMTSIVTIFYYHYQVSCTVHYCMCCAFIQLTAQVCLQQYQHKHLSNVLRYDVTMAMTSRGYSDFPAPWVHQNVIMHITFTVPGTLPWVQTFVLVLQITPQ